VISGLWQVWVKPYQTVYSDAIFMGNTPTGLFWQYTVDLVIFRIWSIGIYNNWREYGDSQTHSFF